MNLSALRVLYNTLQDKELVKVAITSMGQGFVSLDDIENDNMFLYGSFYYSQDLYVQDYYNNIIDIDDAFYCDGMDAYFHIDDTDVAYEGRNHSRYSTKYILNQNFVFFDGEYYDQDALERNDIVYVEDTGEYAYSDNCYYHDCDGWYSYPEDREEYVRGYHNGGYRTLMFNNKSKFKIGYEIEKEDESIRNSIEIDDFESETDNLWRKERDGSLSNDEGFELISPTFELDIDKIFEHIEGNETLVKHINADISSSCGGHIHLSEEGLSGDELFNKIKGYTPLFYALYYGRVNKSYCKGKNNRDLQEENEKYQSIKIHENRVEFRIISAVPSVETLKWRTKLLMMILQNPTDSIIKAYYNVDTKFTKLLKQTYTDDKLLLLKERFIKFTKQFEDIEIKDNQ